MPPEVPPAPAIRFLFMRTILALAVAMLALPAIGGEASGQFKAGTRAPIRPKYATAYEIRDMRDARKRVVEVILTDVPVDAAAAVAELDPHMAVVNQPALQDRNYIILVVRPDGDVSMNATYSERMVQFIDMTRGGSLKAELTTNTAAQVAGRVFAPNPVKTQDESWTVDVKFAADVTRGAAGTKLPADGGEPGKALKALMSAVTRKNWEGIKQGVAADRFSDLDEATSILGMWLPSKAAKITGGEIRGDVATIEMEGEIFEGTKGLFLVRMTKNGPRWILERAVRAGFIK